MAALDFPSSPVANQVYSVGGKSWSWDSTSSSWLGITPSTGYALATSSSAIVGGSASSPDAVVKIVASTTPITYAPVNNPGFTGRVGVNGQQINGFSTVTTNIDCSLSNYYTTSVAGNTTFTVSNIPTSNGLTYSPVYSFTLEIAYTSGTITWFSGVKWANATAPALTASYTSLIVFVTRDGGTTWYGSYLTNFN